MIYHRTDYLQEKDKISWWKQPTPKKGLSCHLQGKARQER
jgi:hypothetical protein